MVLDEPTNDLDLETLELLEELLMEYAGTVLLVSHDREFVNNVVTGTLVFEGNGRVAEYVGGYDDWLRQRKHVVTAPEPKAAPKFEKLKPQRERSRKLTFKDLKELEALPQRIEQLEAEQRQLHQTMADPAFYRNSGRNVVEIQARLGSLEKELADAYNRWEELEALNQ
jgi:ATP-binding cassette subfamily F protein uup